MDDLFRLLVLAAMEDSVTPNLYIIESDAQYLELDKRKQVTIYMFTGNNDTPGKRMMPVFRDLARRYKDVNFAVINAEKLPALALVYLVRISPTFVGEIGGQVVFRFSGADRSQLMHHVQTIDRFAPERSRAQPLTSTTSDSRGGSRLTVKDWQGVVITFAVIQMPKSRKPALVALNSCEHIHLQAGDEIDKINGDRVSSDNPKAALMKLVNLIKNRSEVEIDITRNNERPASVAQKFVLVADARRGGVNLVAPHNTRGCVFIHSLDNSSDLPGLNCRPGTRILSINNENVQSKMLSDVQGKINVYQPYMLEVDTGSSSEYAVYQLRLARVADLSSIDIIGNAGGAFIENVKDAHLRRSLQQGDKIIRVNGQDVSNFSRAAIVKALRDFTGANRLHVRYDPISYLQAKQNPDQDTSPAISARDKRGVTLSNPKKDIQVRNFGQHGNVMIVVVKSNVKDVVIGDVIISVNGNSDINTGHMSVVQSNTSLRVEVAHITKVVEDVDRIVGRLALDLALEIAQEVGQKASSVFDCYRDFAKSRSFQDTVIRRRQADSRPTPAPVPSRPPPTPSGPELPFNVTELDMRNITVDNPSKRITCKIGIIRGRECNIVTESTLLRLYRGDVVIALVNPDDPSKFEAFQPSHASRLSGTQSVTIGVVHVETIADRRDLVKLDEQFQSDSEVLPYFHSQDEARELQQNLVVPEPVRRAPKPPPKPKIRTRPQQQDLYGEIQGGRTPPSSRERAPRIQSIYGEISGSSFSGEGEGSVSGSLEGVSSPPTPRLPVSATSEEIKNQVGGDFAWSDLKDLAEIGSGSDKVVFRAKLRQLNNAEVAVLQFTTSGNLDYRIREKDIMLKLKDKPHVVQLLGSVISDTDKICLICELAPFGSLHDNLHNLAEEGDELPQSVSLAICSQIIEGMIALHELDFRHSDLAARNILAFQWDDNDPSKILVKVSDFGLAKMSSRSYSSEQGIPMRWLPPETLMRRIFTKEADVWSFGVLMWEVWTLGLLPYRYIHVQQDLEKFLDEDKRLDQPVDCPDDVYAVMLECWQKDKKKRPTFTALKDTFAALVTQHA